MNDYFTTVAARNLGFVRPVQPRIPSLHEPPVSEGVDGLRIAPESQPRFESKVAWIDNVPHSDLSPSVLKTPQHMDSTGRPKHDQRDLAAGLPTPAPPAGASLDAVRREPTISDNSEKDAPPANAPPLPSRGTLDSGIMRRRQEQSGELDRESISPQTASARQVTPAAPAPERLDAAIPVEREEAGWGLEALRVTPAETIAANPEGPQPPNELNRPALPPRAPEPSIRITIGRIEVTANTPAPLAKKPRAVPAVPRLSLEEYLKRGREGRR